MKTIQKNNSWLKLHRAILDWEWWDDHNTTRLFLYLLIKANYEDKKWKGIKVPRGSLITGREKLASETGLTEQQIRTSFSKLKSTSEITTKSTNRFTVVSIVKYEDYQHNEGRVTSKTTSEPQNKQPTDNQQITTTKELKKERKKEVIKPDGISEDVWIEWKAHRSKKKASVTDRVVKSLKSEADKASISLQEAMEMCCDRGWTGFNAEWVTGNKNNQTYSKKQFWDAEKRYDRNKAQWYPAKNQDIKIMQTYQKENGMKVIRYL